MIIDGKKVAQEIQQEIKEYIQKLPGRPPCLSVIQVGDHPPSQIYVNRKTESCKAVGIHSIKEVLPQAISQTDLAAKVEELNQHSGIDGILVQLPLPPHINPTSITHCISPEKDVDGFNPYNVGKILIGETDGFLPCTPLGIKVLIERYCIDISGKHALVIGRSNIVGKPMAALLMQGTPGGNATVTVAHRFSLDLKKFCQLADILIVAVGQPKLITEDMVKAGATVIDVGINRVDDPSKKEGYRIIGDVDFDHVAPKCSFITPVPGGVGPMTIAMLLHNTLLSYEKRMKRKSSSAFRFYPLLALAFCLFLCSCQTSSPSNRNPTHFSQNVMTIDYHISIGDPLTHEKKIQIQKIIDATFQEIDAIFNKWNPSSEISRLNALSSNTPTPLSPQLCNFFSHCDALVTLSEGRFDPTIEPLQKLWKMRLEQGFFPTQQEIEALKPFIGWKTIHFANGVFLKDHRETELDFGGIAKGLCVDWLVDRLRLSGLNSLFVEWDGEIRTFGLHPSQRPWRVYISGLADRDPSQAIAQVDLFNSALATSGDYFQNWKIKTEEGEEKIFCHILNPLTLMPLEIKSGSVASASLKASDCLTADALAKVLMLFKHPNEAKEWIEKVQKSRPDLVYWLAIRK